MIKVKNVDEHGPLLDCKSSHCKTYLTRKMCVTKLTKPLLDIREM